MIQLSRTKFRPRTKFRRAKSIVKKKLSSIIVSLLMKKDGAYLNSIYPYRLAIFLGLNSDSHIFTYVIHYLEKKLVIRRHKGLFAKLAKIYQVRGDYQKSREINLRLLEVYRNNPHRLHRHVVQALQVERNLPRKILVNFVKNKEITLPEKTDLLIACELATQNHNIELDWKRIITFLRSEENYDVVLMNFAILAAFSSLNSLVVDELSEIVISHGLSDSSDSTRRSVTMLAAAYYRSGRADKLLMLSTLFDYPHADWQIYMAFGRGDIGCALDNRGKGILNSFLLGYHRKNRGRVLTITPEKDLCGEAFNALYYSSMIKRHGQLRIVCDERLIKVLRRSNPKVEFIPKTPRYKKNIDRAKFDQIPFKLRDYLDNNSFSLTRNSHFQPIPYSELYLDKEVQEKTVTGWITVDPLLKENWKRVLNSSPVKYIGISGTSTARSKIRDVHMIPISYWKNLFDLESTVFVNLDAGLTQSDINVLSNRFSVDIFNPNIDMYNDFDNLLALMSVLDGAVVPANNLMDFSASLGLRSVVFSPTNIMKPWSNPEDNTYYFSSNVKFIFPKSFPADNEAMVLECANYLRDTIFTDGQDSDM